MRRPAILILAAAIVAALQIGLLAWTISTRAAVLRDGREVLLKVVPIDPRDLLRGDYVILGYEMSRLDGAMFEAIPAGDPVYGDKPVWVVLRKGAENLFMPVKAALNREALTGLTADDVVVQGVTYDWPIKDQQVSVRYGIERFYLPEGAGKQIEKDMRERPFFVVVAVDGNGTAQIKSFKDGKTTLFEEAYY